MNKMPCFFFILSLLFLGACSGLQPNPEDLTATVTPTDSAAVPISDTPTPLPDILETSLERVHNAKYQLGLLDQIRVVQLTDGRYQEGSPGNENYLSVAVTEFVTWGDLTADGQNEVVAIITENYGFVGTFVFLVVFQYIDDEAVFLTSVFLDDRPMINALVVEDGRVFIDVVIHDRDDPSCCPSLATTRRYFLNGFNMILTNYTTLTPTGKSREITIEAPVEEIQVSGVIRIKGSVTIAPFENNLIYRVYDLGGVELSAGPVNVEAAGLGAPGSFVKAIDLGDILTNTSIRITVEDINVADGSLFALDSVILQVR